MSNINQSRRRFIRNGLLTPSVIAASAVIPPSIRKALAIPVNNATGTINDVQHVVFLMQENRSFDHYFGTLPGIRGFGDHITIPGNDGNTIWKQKRANGTVLMPYHLDQSKGNAQRAGGTPHSWSDAKNAWNKGKMDHWPQYKNDLSMGYLTEQELPFQFALANAFTICDGYFCSLHGGTNTNRMFFWTGNNGANTANGHVVVNNVWDSIGDPSTGFDYTTYPERLESAGVSWKVYQNLPDNYTDNSLAGFKQYRQQYKDALANQTGATYPTYDADRDAANWPLLKGVANTMTDGGFLAAFQNDVANDNLPQVSWIVAPATYSEHPGPSSPAQGAWYTQTVLDALTSNPDIWSKTVFFVNFDENDGFFDHLPPPCAPSLKSMTVGDSYGKSTLSNDDMSYEYYTHPAYAGTGMPANDGDCYGPGPRVPMLVISPWSKGGWVNSQQFDHTSALRFLEARFGVKEENISPYRRAVFGDMTSVFNFKTPNSDIPSDIDKWTKATADALITAQKAMSAVSIPSPQSLPIQPSGLRPSRALPYELHASARTDISNKAIRLIFSNTGTQAAVLHVYDMLNLDSYPRRYAIEAGKELDDTWDLSANGGLYDLAVFGPNGFHRSFAGDLSVQAASNSPDPEVRVCYDIANGNVYLTAMNAGDQPAHISVTADAAYTGYFDNGPWNMTVEASSTAEIHWDLTNSKRWYDFTVRCSDISGFSRRFAGRVETGQDGYSDPAFGFDYNQKS